MEPCGKDGLRGEFGVAWLAVETMLHIGQPSFGEKAIWVDDVGSGVENKDERQLRATSKSGALTVTHVTALHGLNFEVNEFNH